MEILYAKTFLYSYVHLMDVAKQIDELVEKKAFSSINNYSPALVQYETIVQLTYEKDIVYVIKKVCDKALEKFTQEEKKFFEYKYFRNKPKSYFDGFDTSSRAYFRKQISLVKTFSKRVEKLGIDDKFFKEKCLSIEFFRQLLKRTEERELSFCKGKSGLK